VSCGIGSTDVIFDDFPDQAIDSTSSGCDELQNIGAPDFLIKGSLDCHYLPANSAHTFKELGFLLSGLKHGKIHLC
jgi:hypothetical protein